MWSRFLSLPSALPTPLLPSLALPSSMLDVIFWISAAACMVAQWFILRAVWRVIPSATGSPNVPVPRRAQEIAWAILPALFLLAVFVTAWRAMHPAAFSELNTPVPTSHGAPQAPAVRS